METNWKFVRGIAAVAALLVALQACTRQIPLEQSTSANQPTIARNEDPKNVPVGDDVTVTPDLLFKEGTTNVYRVDPSEIPNAPAIPNGYQVLAANDESLKANYHVLTTAVVSGLIISIRVPIDDKDEFDKVRVLKLDREDFVPGEFAWTDCTIRKAEEPAQPRTPTQPRTRAEAKPNHSDTERYNQRRERWFSNFESRRVSCESDRPREEGIYLAVVTQTANPPAEPFTKIELALAKIEKVKGGDETVYTVSIKNAGLKNAAEVNFDSTFGGDTQVVDVKPSKGRCEPARHGSTYESKSCFLGGLGPGEIAMVEFRGRPSGLPSGSLSGKPNINWSIRGVARENQNDYLWHGSRFSFRPLAKGK